MGGRAGNQRAENGRAYCCIRVACFGPPPPPSFVGSPERKIDDQQPQLDGDMALIQAKVAAAASEPTELDGAQSGLHSGGSPSSLVCD